jgi:hypothetical protein
LLREERLIYRNQGINDLGDDELKVLAWQQDFRMSILGDVLKMLAAIVQSSFWFGGSYSSGLGGGLPSPFFLSFALALTLALSNRVVLAAAKERWD